MLVLSECNAAIHKKCIDKVIAKCTGSAVNSRETMVCITICFFFKQVSFRSLLHIYIRASAEKKKYVTELQVM